MNALSPLTASALVALGGGAGAVLRFQLARAMVALLGADAVLRFPWATLAANVIGCLAMGLLTGVLARSGGSGEAWRLLLGVGLLGGFTTFSSFGLELFMLVDRGHLVSGFAYAAVSVLAGLAALFIGLSITRMPA
ncbi:camphor resistance protein CrcB [Altererythrobacter sp. B11]|uniref:fluoride efflux transporter CrcB n=1 Tax=Altererythrobacter sp. B11 TaxID=2060312 RepID=UPI000DC70D62|nr:fluoride efflux transporter CrcB [Altererythrobacter sp. B11]BBC74196.1 camphor resistance protein CrcB [Altererythrobacter sp. B11]